MLRLCSDRAGGSVSRDIIARSTRSIVRSERLYYNWSREVCVRELVAENNPKQEAEEKAQVIGKLVSVDGRQASS
jgi:hypothetical protein